MPTYTLEVEVEARGIYEVEAENEQEARRIFDSWNGDDSVVFSHYSEEYPGKILWVTRD